MIIKKENVWYYIVVEVDLTLTKISVNVSFVYDFFTKHVDKLEFLPCKN